MSRLADLLNPAPSSARGSPTVEALDTTGAQQSTRLPSLASPLEGLALAADQQATAPRHSNPAQQYSSLDASARPDATTMATERETTVKSENGIPDELDQRETDVPMVDAVVKQEPTDAAACLSDEPKPTNEDDSVANIKTEPMQHDESSTVPQNTSILPTTEKSRPASKAAPKKTSTAKKAAPRKRKAEQASKDGTPASQRSGTPASNRASKSVATKNAQPSPARSFADEEDEGEDGGVFCICRGPDDHTWMIGCDGECEDWFHGRCVNMKQEDADLVDKYICPNCEKKGIGVTTWKPMCRLEGCRKPARVSGPAPSKYCSDEHGREFMRQRVLQRSHRGDKQPAKKKRHVEADQAAGTLQSTAEAEGAHQAYLRGGLLDPGELKALTDGVKDTAEFKRLGESVLPMNGTHDRPTDNGTQHDQGPEISEANGDTCLPEEKQHLETVLAKAATVRHQLGALHDKELFLGLVKARATLFVAEAMKAAGDSKKKDAGKDICRFDWRLSWSDVEFDEWRHSPEGRSALDAGNLGPLAGPAPDAVDGDGDAVMQDVAGEDRGPGVCSKRRCERHKAWYKLHQQEIAYDRRECEDQLAKLGAEARGIEERAIMRKLEGTGDAVNGG